MTSRFVSLAEALSWIAFGELLDPIALRKRIARDVTDTDPRFQLRRAVKKFTSAASNGRLSVRGRYVPDFRNGGSAALANTDDIPPNRLKDFGQFDLDVCGLRRRPEGADYIIWSGDSQRAFAREFASYADEEGGPLSEGYRDVEVSHDDLLAAFPPTRGAKFTTAERHDWIRNCEERHGDKAYRSFKQHPKYDGTKQEAFRVEWKSIRKPPTGRPPRQQSPRIIS